MSDAKIPIIADSPPNDGREWECQCARCGSSIDWHICEHCCGDGLDGHDCGDDCCCCLYPEDNVECDVCLGAGGWWDCLSSPGWCIANPLPGREHVERGNAEWYATAPSPEGD